MLLLNVAIKKRAWHLRLALRNRLIRCVVLKCLNAELLLTHTMCAVEQCIKHDNADQRYWYCQKQALNLCSDQFLKLCVLQRDQIWWKQDTCLSKNFALTLKIQRLTTREQLNGQTIIRQHWISKVILHNTWNCVAPHYTLLQCALPRFDLCKPKVCFEEVSKLLWDATWLIMKCYLCAGNGFTCI